MPANKNALIRYKTIDNCLRNRYRRWTLDDLVDACCEALYDMEGITKGVCTRTVQMDIQIMRSDKLGYNAPIEVYDRIYYRYADPSYSITEMPLSADDCKLIKEAITLLGNKENTDNARTRKVLKKVENRLTARTHSAWSQTTNATIKHHIQKSELQAGFEPATCSLQVSCTTTVLLKRFVVGTRIELVWTD